MSILENFIQFYKHPTLENEDLKFSQKSFKTFQIWCLFYIFVFGLSILVAIISDQIGYDGSKHAISQSIAENGILSFVILGVLIAPFSEELMFRGVFTKSKFVNSIALGFFISQLSYIIEKFFFNWIFSNELIDFLLYIFHLSIIPLIIGLVFYFLLKTYDSNILVEKTNEYFKYLLYLNIILFASAHLLNFVGLNVEFYLLPIFVLPQFFLGFALSYVRVKFGYIYSSSFHLFHNAFSLIPIFILSTIPTDHQFAEMPNWLILIDFGLTLLFVLIFLISIYVSIVVIVKYFRTTNFKYFWFTNKNYKPISTTSIL